MTIWCFDSQRKSKDGYNFKVDKKLSVYRFTSSPHLARDHELHWKDKDFDVDIDRSSLIDYILRCIKQIAE